ncbi:hypothetical protein B0H67DRAFT_67407 [Lasiosphaeris hirsuta]|uniref:Uncharacterized protein n=1 Tax=Lasiosphaeris hirsuta TaxID=260670 RepID=A0AA40BBP7_9PEZI|nr:hypothetical protein B0H67DRAFT_67407 [Lasiosphaeris hirsuta]
MYRMAPSETTGGPTGNGSVYSTSTSQLPLLASIATSGRGNPQADLATDITSQSRPTLPSLTRPSKRKCAAGWHKFQRKKKISWSQLEKCDGHTLAIHNKKLMRLQRLNLLTLWKLKRRPKPLTIDHQKKQDPITVNQGNFDEGLVRSGSVSSVETQDKSDRSDSVLSVSTNITTPDDSGCETKGKVTKTPLACKLVTVTSTPEASNAEEKGVGRFSATHESPAEMSLEHLEPKNQELKVTASAPVPAPRAAAVAVTTLSPAATCGEPAAQNSANEGKQRKKRMLDDDEGSTSKPAQEPKPKKAKLAAAAASPAVTMTPVVPAPKFTRGGPSNSKKYFEINADKMREDPLGFDDLVYEDKRPAMAQKIFRKFQRFRRHQGPPPSVDMFGAIGAPQPRADVNTNKKGQVAAGGLSKDTLKRIHQKRIGEEVELPKGNKRGGGQGGSHTDSTGVRAGLAKTQPNGIKQRGGLWAGPTKDRNGGGKLQPSSNQQKYNKSR